MAIYREKGLAALALKELDQRRNETVVVQCIWTAGLIRAGVMPSIITSEDATKLETCAVEDDTVKGEELLQSLRQRLESIVNK